MLVYIALVECVLYDRCGMVQSVERCDEELCNYDGYHCEVEFDGVPVVNKESVCWYSSSGMCPL